MSDDGRVDLGDRDDMDGKIVVEHHPFRIVHADPVVYLPAAEIKHALDWPQFQERMKVDGDVLTLSDEVGNRYIYRIDWTPLKAWTNPETLYRCEWPD